MGLCSIISLFLLLALDAFLVNKQRLEEAKKTDPTFGKNLL